MGTSTAKVIARMLPQKLWDFMMTAKFMRHCFLAPALRSLGVCASSHAEGASVCSTLVRLATACSCCLPLCSAHLLFCCSQQAATLLSLVSLCTQSASVCKPEWNPAQLNYCVIHNACCRAFESFTLNRDKLRGLFKHLWLRVI